MRIGFVGLGKLGFPCAVAMALKGHDVIGYDINPGLMNLDARRYKECGETSGTNLNDLLEKSKLKFGSLDQVAKHSEIIFVAVQTPHQAHFEGITPLGSRREDFDYRFLVDAVGTLANSVKRKTPVVVISTVLPGTMREYIEPLLSAEMQLVYNPYFIAMGTTMPDFLDPEFVLLGSNHDDARVVVREFYKTIHGAPICETTIENAELIKVAYNTFIGMKIAFANTLMEICHATPNTNVDEITRGLSHGTRRLLSDKYLFAGMGDGGGCHPRDNIALSWLARKLDLSYDWFENVMLARERQTEWLARLMVEQAREHGLPLAILGYSFKPESNLIVGSPALLLKNILSRWGFKPLMHDPLVDQTLILNSEQPMVFLIGCKHEAFRDYVFPAGSVVIDPWRYLDIKQQKVSYIPVGVGPTESDLEIKKTTEQSAEAAD